MLDEIVLQHHHPPKLAVLLPQPVEEQGVVETDRELRGEDVEEFLVDMGEGVPVRMRFEIDDADGPSLAGQLGENSDGGPAVQDVGENPVGIVVAGEAGPGNGANLGTVIPGDETATGGKKPHRLGEREMQQLVDRLQKIHLRVHLEQGGEDRVALLDLGNRKYLEAVVGGDQLVSLAPLAVREFLKLLLRLDHVLGVAAFPLREVAQ